MGKGEEALKEGRRGGGEEGRRGEERSEEKDGKGRNMYTSKTVKFHGRNCKYNNTRLHCTSSSGDTDPPSPWRVTGPPWFTDPADVVTTTAVPSVFPSVFPNVFPRGTASCSADVLAPPIPSRELREEAREPSEMGRVAGGSRSAAFSDSRCSIRLWRWRIRGSDTVFSLK